MIRRIGRLAQLNSTDRHLLIRCFWTLVYVRLWLSLRGYARLRARLERSVVPEARLAGLAPRIVWAVRHASRLVPAASCLTQAVAAQHLLSRSGTASKIRIGVLKEEGGRFRAHAWLLADNRIVLGGSAREVGRFIPMADLEERRS